MLLAVKLSLSAQIVLTLAAIVLAVVAMTSNVTADNPGMAVSSGIVVSAPVILSGVLLLVAGTMGVVAVRLRRLYLRSSIILLAPLVLAVATSISTPSGGDADHQAWFAYETGLSIKNILRLLEWSSWLTLGAVLLSSAAAVLLLLVRRRRV